MNCVYKPIDVWTFLIQEINISLETTSKETVETSYKGKYRHHLGRRCNIFPDSLALKVGMHILQDN